MKNIKISKVIHIFLLVLLLIIGSYSSLGISTVSNNTEYTIENNSDASIRIKSQNKLISNSIITNEVENPKDLEILSFDGTNNIVITNTTASESRPSMVIKGVNGVVSYEYKEGANPLIYLRKTDDFGQSWSKSYNLQAQLGTETSINSPSMSINPKTGYTYGAFLSKYNNSGIHGIFEISNIAGDISNIDPTMWDWSYVYQSGSYIGSWWGFKDITIKYHNNNDAPWISTFIGSTNYTDSETGTGPCNNAIMFGYLGSGGTNDMWIQWEPEYANCSNLSTAMNDDSKKLYGISEKLNGTNTDLLFFYGTYKTGTSEPYIDLIYYNFTGPENLFHPKIFVKDNYLFVAAETDSNGIILYRSTNSGASWTLNNLTGDFSPPFTDPKYPELYANTTHLTCAFIDSGDIFLTSTPVISLSWSTPVKLNDVSGKVVSNYRFSNMPDNNHILWTDTRDGNNDIYSSISSTPEYDLKINDMPYVKTMGYSFLQTKNIINFTISNIGEFPVEDVDIKILYWCTNKPQKETNYPGYIAYLNGNGAEKTFNLYLFRINIVEFLGALANFAGLQNITIIIDPEQEYSDKNRDDNIYTIPASFSDIFPFFGNREAIFTK